MAIVHVSLSFDSPSKERLASLASVIGAVKNTTGNAAARIADGVDRTRSVNTEEQGQVFFAGAVVSEWVEAEQQRKKTNPVCSRELFFFMTPDELAALWHLPHEEFTNTKTQWVDESLKPLPSSLKALDIGIMLGTNGDTTVFLPNQTPEDRTQHTIIIGKPGTGKSSLMHGIIHQDIAAGKGVCVIDPHGFLVRDILQASIPTWRDNDVVVLDFANGDNPPPLNPLYRPSGLPAQVAADLLRDVLMKIYPEFANREMADTLQMVLLTLTAANEPTPLDVIRIFDEAEYRQQLISKMDDYTIENPSENSYSVE